MNLLSKELVSPEYRDQIRRDLARATVCRFLVAYISMEGLNAIDPLMLNKALQDTRSFGIASMSCSCGYKPLINLQSGLGAGNIRLKYFMDPIVLTPDEPNDVSLFHSKLVYLFLEREQKSVIFIGSHNWSTRALGPDAPRNTEASVRLEFDFVTTDLDGTGSSMPAHVNRHLLEAWNAPACFPATSDFEPRFKDWMRKGCQQAPPVPVKEATTILAICKKPPLLSDWLALQDSGIYVQALEEEEGKKLWDSNDPILVLVWESESALIAGNQPFILKTRKTASNAGPNSQVAGNNQADSPMEGFKAVILDEVTLANMQTSTRRERQSVRIWSGRDVKVFDFEFPTSRTESSQVDAGIKPRYQIYLQSEAVIFPADHRIPPSTSFVWERETFAVADSRKAARFEQTPGYFAPPDVRERILKFLHDVLRVDLKKATVLPYSDLDPKAGKRISQHPLHDTYIAKDSRSRPAEFYAKGRESILTPEIDQPGGLTEKANRRALFPQSVPRVQKVFTTPLKDLFALWKERAHDLLSHRPTEED